MSINQHMKSKKQKKKISKTADVACQMLLLQICVCTIRMLHQAENIKLKQAEHTLLLIAVNGNRKFCI